MRCEECGEILKSEEEKNYGKCGECRIEEFNEFLRDRKSNGRQRIVGGKR